MGILNDLYHVILISMKDHLKLSQFMVFIENYFIPYFFVAYFVNI